MAVILHMVKGPRRGEVVTLVEGPNDIGRGPDNHLQIEDDALSRHHCTITWELERATIRDVGSRNGTFVNGEAVSERALADGDTITIGVSEFVVVLGTPVAVGEGEEPHLSDEPLSPTAVTTSLSVEQARYLGRQLGAIGDATSDRHLRTVLNLVKGAFSAQSVEGFQEDLLALMLDVLPDCDGAVVMTRTGLDQDPPIVQRTQATSHGMVLSRTIVRQVIEKRAAVCYDDPGSETTLRGAASIAMSRPKAVLCAPLVYQDQAFGAIYFATTNPSTRFDRDDLELVTAVGHLAGMAMTQAQQAEWLREESAELRVELGDRSALLLGGRVLEGVLGKARRVADTDTTVLIRGESGTGKSLLARAIHSWSRRAGKPWVKIDCSTLSETLIENELFGHERGAFTDAKELKIGLLERANGRTAFFDEIGTMSPGLQQKLLGVLQDGRFERLGGKAPISVDLRVIAATNVDIEAAVKAGTFREDLYYRLNVVSLTMPPLRERRDEIEPLCDHFLHFYARKCRRRVRGISSAAMDILKAYDWPGNVRELENAIEYAVAIGADDLLDRDDLPEWMQQRAPSGVATSPRGYHAHVTDCKRALIRDAVREAEGNISRAARQLELNPRYLHRLLNELGLRESLA